MLTGDKLRALMANLESDRVEQTTSTRNTDKLDDPDVRLHSFIVSNTPSATMRRQWNMEKSEVQKRHVLFQEEDRDSYPASKTWGAVRSSGWAARTGRCARV